MKNKKGKSLIGLLLLLVAVGIFGYFGYSTMGAIKLGLDLAGGVKRIHADTIGAFSSG